jgi:hypothetical protein
MGFADKTQIIAVQMGPGTRYTLNIPGEMLGQIGMLINSAAVFTIEHFATVIAY